MPDAGLLRSRVTFARRDVVDDGGGGGTVNWTPMLSTRGYLRPERGREALAAGRPESSSMAVLQIRSSLAARAIDASYRVSVDDVPYNVRSIINPDQRNRFLELLVERGVAQ